ncbi:phage tail protein [Pseudactinotalea sp. Z1739]|uniref:phage tail protein n=1 Tax=Pseudactinotalea sp. Z1739 TaxID=3413028 RepID=UPI003C7BCCAA
MSTGETVTRLRDLLPVHHLAQEPDLDEGPPGPLTALLTAVAGELDVLEEDVRRLGDGWFIETCEEWLVPYLADLIGLGDVPPDLGTAMSRRALVANTVAYRRRKGTLGVLGQVTRDVTGWPTRAVEHHPLLVAATHLNHVRLGRAAVAALRPAVVLERGAVRSPPAATQALDPLMHTAEVRRTARRRGRYGIRSIAVYPFPVHAQLIGAAGVGSTSEAETPRGPAGGWSRTRASGGWHHLDPLGRPTPLFAPPRPQPALAAHAQEEDLPVPLRPRRLLELLRTARAGDLDPAALPVGVRIGPTGTDLGPERLRVCHLEDLAPGDDPQVLIDAVAGRLRAYRNGAHYVPSTVFVRYTYGAAADIGAGPYGRTARHTDLLGSDTWTPPVSTGAGAPRDVQVSVDSGADPAMPLTVADVASGLTSIEAAWSDPAGTAVGATATVSIADSARYPANLAVEVPPGTRLVLVAARWRERVLPNGNVEAPAPGRYTPDGLRPHLRGTVQVTGGPGSSLVLDGLLLEGDLVIEPGDLGSLTIAHTTLTGSVQVRSEPEAANATLQVRLERAAVGAVAAGPSVPLLRAVDCVLDPQGLPAGTAALDLPGAHADLEGTTIRGQVRSRSLEASNCLLDGRVEVARRQIGCVRFSYVGPESHTPRRYRCVPADGSDGTPQPVYVSTDPASPAYLVLSASCAPAIREGGERESEMGAHHHQYRPLRRRAAERQIGPYLPVGSEIGIFGS